MAYLDKCASIMTQRARLEVGIIRLPKPPCWNTEAQGEVGSDTCPALPPILALSSTLSSFRPTVWTPQTAHWAHYTGSWSLVALWPRVFPTSGAIYSCKDRLGMRSAKALKSGRKPFGQVGSGLLDSSWAQPFGSRDSSFHKQSCLMRGTIAGLSKLCIPGQGPSCLGLRVILLCAGVHYLLIMQNAQNVLFQLALEGDVQPCMCYPDVSGGLGK